jgi:hypothetical protein
MVFIIILLRNGYNKPVYSACILAMTETPFFQQVRAKVLADRLMVRERGNCPFRERLFYYLIKPLFSVQIIKLPFCAQNTMAFHITL